MQVIERVADNFSINQSLLSRPPDGLQMNGLKAERKQAQPKSGIHFKSNESVCIAASAIGLSLNCLQTFSAHIFIYPEP